MLGKFSRSFLVFFFESFVATLEAKSCALCSCAFVGKLAHARFCHAKVGRQWNVAGAHKVATAALYAIGQTVGAQLFLVVGAGVPEQLLRQQLNRANRGAFPAPNAGLFIAEWLGVRVE